MANQETFEYAGFEYLINHLKNGKITLTPVAGRHPAANKAKHLHNALEEYKKEKAR